MNRNASDRVHDYFTASSRDVTPPSAHRMARVLYVPASSDPEVSRLCATVLSASEGERSERFAAEHERGRFQQRRAFRRFCAAAALDSSRSFAGIVFAETRKGRAYLPESRHLWFSFSSCRDGALGAWSATHAIGVDIEDRTKELEAVELAREFFSRAEAEAVEAAGLERLETFYRLWSLKEAALKSIGEGLPFGLDAFEFELHPTARVVRAPPDQGGPERFDACLLEGTAACAALVVRDRTAAP